MANELVMSESQRKIYQDAMDEAIERYNVQIADKPSNKLGGKKYDDGKVPLELLPPQPLYEVARVLQFGAKKYDAYNWYEGITFGRLFGAAMRHLYKFWVGEDDDDESGLCHLAHALCCIMFLFQFHIEKRKECDDRNKYRSVGLG